MKEYRATISFKAKRSHKYTPFSGAISTGDYKPPLEFSGDNRRRKKHTFPFVSILVAVIYALSIAAILFVEPYALVHGFALGIIISLSLPTAIALVITKYPRK